MIKFRSKLDYSGCSILIQLQPGSEMFWKSIQRRIAIIQFRNSGDVEKDFCTSFVTYCKNSNLDRRILVRNSERPISTFQLMTATLNLSYPFPVSGNREKPRRNPTKYSEVFVKRDGPSILVFWFS